MGVKLQADVSAHDPFSISAIIIKREGKNSMETMRMQQVDAMALSPDRACLYLLMYDDMGWEQEKEHMLLLQDKLYTYRQYIADESYRDTYPEIEAFEKVVIRVHFSHTITPFCVKYMEGLVTHLGQYSIGLEYTMDEGPVIVPADMSAAGQRQEAPQ